MANTETLRSRLADLLGAETVERLDAISVAKLIETLDSYEETIAVLTDLADAMAEAIEEAHARTKGIGFPVAGSSHIAAASYRSVREAAKR